LKFVSVFLNKKKERKKERKKEKKRKKKGYLLKVF